MSDLLTRLEQRMDELERLSIQPATPRRAVQMCVSSPTPDEVACLYVIASDDTIWACPDGGQGWHQLPPLPQPEVVAGEGLENA